MRAARVVFRHDSAGSTPSRLAAAWREANVRGRGRGAVRDLPGDGFAMAGCRTSRFAAASADAWTVTADGRCRWRLVGQRAAAGGLGAALLHYSPDGRAGRARAAANVVPCPAFVGRRAKSSVAPARERRQRFEMFRLAQRVAPGLVSGEIGVAGPPHGSLATFAAALTGVRDCRALMFTLERMQMRHAVDLGGRRRRGAPRVERLRRQQESRLPPFRARWRSSSACAMCGRSTPRAPIDWCDR